MLRMTKRKGVKTALQADHKGWAVAQSQTSLYRSPAWSPWSQEPLFHANNFLLRNLHANKIYSGQEPGNPGS